MAFFGLGRPTTEVLKSRRDVDSLIDALEYGKNSAVRQCAAEALGESGDSRAVEPLVAALKGSDRDMHVAAAKGTWEARSDGGRPGDCCAQGCS